MILWLLRLLFTSFLLVTLGQVVENQRLHPNDGDIANAGLLWVALLLGVATAVVWAPLIGDNVAGPLTTMMTDSTYVERRNWLIDLIHGLNKRRFRRLTLLACFAEGVHRPWSPTAFVVGMKCSKPGSWFEKVFSREVFRFDNIQHCIEAYQRLERHGVDPRPHKRTEINLAIMGLRREERAEQVPLAVPKNQPITQVLRNQQIPLFGAAKDAPKLRLKSKPGQPPPAAVPEAPVAEEDGAGADAQLEPTEQRGFFSRVWSFLKGA